MNVSSEPKLAAPGAGLPPFELLLACFFFGLRRLTTSRASVNGHFHRERAWIHRLVQGVAADAGAQRVLIQRVRGLEDSSRHWSVWMTLDHLRIVNLEIARVITALAQGHPPTGAASTAAVKPDPQANSSVAGEYEAACEAFLAAAAAVPDLKTAARFAHPWFGPMDAAGWHALASGHMGIHREQIKRILAGAR